jgi:hypothetical protein
LGCSVSHSRRKEKGRAYLEDALVSGKGLGKVRTNGAAARPVVAARGGRAREERVREKGKVSETEGGDEPEALSGERLSLSGRAVSEPSSSEPAT